MCVPVEDNRRAHYRCRALRPHASSARFSSTAASPTSSLFTPALRPSCLLRIYLPAHFSPNQLSREQTGFVEGVWQERRRLEAELGARKEEVERLRASEDAARMAATVLEVRVEDLSSALRKGVSRAKRDASRGAEAEIAAAGEEAREAMEAIRRQLDDLRREVDKTKRDQTRSDQPAWNGHSERTDRLCQNDQSRRAKAQRSTGGTYYTVQGAAGKPGEGMVVGPSQDRSRDGGDETEGQGHVAADARMTSVVLEGEFQRLRAKYEKAKGRIAALEEQVAATRRAGAHARREFQVGALFAPFTVGVSGDEWV